MLCSGHQAEVYSELAPSKHTQSCVIVCTLMGDGCAGTLFGATPIPVVDNSGGIAPFCDATGQFMPLLCTMNCTLAPEEVRRCLHPSHALAVTSRSGLLRIQRHTWAWHDCLGLRELWKSLG